MKLIAITGGIGSGKSVVSQLLRVLGHPVYDCDERAKWVMEHDSKLISQLTALFGAQAYHDGKLNKPYLSQCIFADTDKLSQMNACVHPAVARDIYAMARQLEARGIDHLYYESAILYESGFDHLCPPDEVWTVSAPLELRIQRAMRRDHATRQQVLARIDSQMPQAEKERRAHHIILNDNRHSIIEQVRKLC